VKRRRPPVITIDGPAGAGKSTVAVLVARRLGLLYLDTGAMYRAFTWKALEEGIPLENPRAVLRMIRRTLLEIRGRRVFVDGRDVTRSIRSRRVTEHVRWLADEPAVRRELVRRQRAIGRRGVVTEGRDQGTVAFPDALLKVYLDARIEVRARRRLRDARRLGERVSYRQILRDLRRRDAHDRRRRVGALRVPRGAVRIDTTRLSVRQVVDRIVRLARGLVD
jgi:cytidylate kinase